MLSEKAIIKFSVAAIILGLFGIYLTLIFTQPINVPLSEINDSLSGKILETKGRISALRVSNTSTAFITLEDEKKEILVIKFNSNENEFKKGDLVSVTGEVTRYEGNIEIVARQIKTN
jgi:DNA/RNA endonuclease YhcR with UshA esterase domain